VLGTLDTAVSAIGLQWGQDFTRCAC